MQKLLSFSNPNYRSSFAKDEDEPEVLTTDIYHFTIDQLYCFIFVCNFDGEKDSGYYSSVFIHRESRKMFEFNIELDIEAFDSNLYEHLTTKTKQKVAELFVKHGYMSVSKNTFNLDTLLKQQGVANIPTQILDLLDDSAIQVLSSIHLGIVPKFYNWLIECDTPQRKRRTAALLNYPIHIISVVEPIVYIYYPKLIIDEEPTDDDNLVNLELSKRIDTGEPIEAILTDLIGISAKTLTAITGKTFKDITQEKQPILYKQFKDEIEAYRKLALLNS